MGRVKVDKGFTTGKSVHKQINDLIQLQELLVARGHQAAGKAKTKKDPLQSSIQALLKEVPEAERTQFTKLSQKGLLCIVPVSNDVCTACGMGLPKSMVQAIRAAERVYACPSCARLLYVPEVEFRGKSQRQMRGQPAKTGIVRFSSPELMVPRLGGTTRDEVLAELTDRLEAEGFVVNGDEIYQEALNREAIVSTAVDHSLAFPHVRGVEGGGLIMTLGMSKKGIKFDESVRTLTRMVFFMVIPTAASAFYLKLLAGLTQAFREKEIRDALLAETTSEGMWKALVKSTRSTVS